MLLTTLRLYCGRPLAKPHYGPTTFNVLSVQRQTLHLHGTAMDSPVSVVDTKIVKQNIVEQVLPTYTQTIPLCLR